MREQPDYVPLEEARPRIGKLADQAHEEGGITYLTRHGKAIAAIVPVGGKATALPAAILDAAYDAAFPGLPGGMSEGEARRRLTAALNVSYAHLADVLDRAFTETANAAVTEGWRLFAGEGADGSEPSG